MADQGVTETTTTTDGGQGGGEAAAPDPMERLTSAFEAFQTNVGSRLDSFEQRLPADEPQGDDDEEELPELEYEFTDEDFDEQGQLSQQAQMREIERVMRAVAREEQQPLIAEREEQRRIQEADAIENRYPILQDEAEQDKYVEMTVEAARRIGRPDLAREPAFFEMVLLSDLGRQGIAAETPAGTSQGATLERGGGAPPAEGQSSTDEEGDRIVAVSRSQRFRLGTR